ncbi:MAG: ABC transporter permease subunit [Emcibacteraceae bacterium]|nr:ABC transporter permease subunit [Emcibacteraceae bacterium]MDG1996308.1 ABC transporter permease subunit [Emcibacteraceae bacterium]
MIKKLSLINTFYLILFGHLGFWLLAPRLPYPQLIADTIDIANVFGGQNFRPFFDALFNSVTVAALVIAINLIFALPIAMMLTLYQNKATNIISSLLYIPVLAPALLPAFGLYELFIRTNIIGSHLSIAVAQSAILFPYMLKPIENFLRNRGYSMEQVAYDLGESKFRTFIKVTLPSLIPAITFGGFLSFIGSFNDYLIAFLIGDLKINTLSVTLYPLIQSDNRTTSIITILIYITPLILLVAFSARLKLVTKTGKQYAKT